MDDKVRNFKFWCQKVIPLVYDDSISYYETLCKVSQKLNEVIDYVNNFQDTSNDYTDEQINILRDYLQNQINITNYNLEQLKINGKKYVDNEILKVTGYINDQISVLNKLITNNNDYLKNWVEEQIENLINNLPEIQNVVVVNPTTGLMDSLQNTLNNMWNGMRSNAINCSQFDGSLITCTEFDNLNITAYEFDFNSLNIIFKDPNFYMTSPITGDYILIKQVVNQLYDLHRQNTITAEEFDNTSGLTVTIFDGYNLSAEQFDNTGLPY